jgi:uncharacterized protein (DUF362 family)
MSPDTIERAQVEVGVAQDDRGIGYPVHPPFSPCERYPEYPFDDLAPARGPADGAAYDLVRRVFRGMRLDPDHLDTAQWNPLGGVVRPGDTVVLKPNLVLHSHSWGMDVKSVVTHGSVVRAVLDYVTIALRGDGKIIIGDAPLQSCDFESVTALTGIRGVVDYYASRVIPVELVDFRKVESRFTADGVVDSRTALEGDPLGTTPVDLGGLSRLAGIAEGYHRYRVTNYDPREMSKHHNESVNEYLIANSILQADVVINIPKIKTHRKVGVTAALKNLVGINGHKDWLPHHRQGSADEGGDEYRYANRAKRLASDLLDSENSSDHWVAKRAYHYPRRALNVLVKLTRKDPFWEGSWFGNDTAWRMVHDLNRILLYASRTGRIEDERQRRVFTVADGIIAGEAEGPLEPTPKPVGVIVAGLYSGAVDAVIARLMGFDYRKIPVIREAFEQGEHPLVPFPPQEIRVVSDMQRWNGCDLTGGSDSLRFEPPDGWKGHIEISDEATARLP